MDADEVEPTPSLILFSSRRCPADGCAPGSQSATITRVRAPWRVFLRILHSERSADLEKGKAERAVVPSASISPLSSIGRAQSS